MVKIANAEELRNIQQSDYGFIIIGKNNPIIHLTNCKIISENDFLKEINNEKYNWFSTYSLAQKELGDLISCTICNPDRY